MKMPLVNTLITFRILLPICTFYSVSFYSLIYRNKIPWHNQKVRVHFLFSHWESKLLWHGFLLYIFLWSVVGLVYATISSHPLWASNTSDGWPPAVESTSTTLPEKKRWPTLSTRKRRRRKTMLVVFLMGNEKPQLYRPQKRGYFQVLALRYISNSFIFSLSPHMLPSFGATWCCTSLNQIISWFWWSYNWAFGVMSMELLWALTKIERLCKCSDL